MILIEMISFSNSNHAVYVRRLEKRKARIKELEEMYKKEAESSETYRIQLNDCREQLEQLENCQNQELSKVKSMLLSAEKSLEIERQKNASNQTSSEVLVQTEESVIENGCHKRIPENLSNRDDEEVIPKHSGEEKREIYSHRKNISSNQLFSDFISKCVAFTKFLPKKRESKFP